MATYIALVRKETRSSYGIDFPDFPGCIGVGNSLDQAVTNARDALNLHILGMQEDGLPIPRPQSLEQILRDPANRDAVPVLIVAKEVSPLAK